MLVTSQKYDSYDGHLCTFQMTRISAECSALVAGANDLGV